MLARAGQPGSESQRAASVRVAGVVPQPLLLPVPTGDGGEPGTDAAVGRVASGASGLGRWFDGYNQERPHQALGYATPAEVYFDPGAHGAQPASWEAMQPQGAHRPRKT